MVFLIGKVLFAERTGLFSAFLVAILSFQGYYSQKARMYSLMALLTLLLVYFLIRALRNNKAVFWFGFVVTNLLNIYYHYYIGVLLWLAEAIYIINFSGS